MKSILNYKYFLLDGLNIIRELEGLFSYNGLHLALAGSLVYKGVSNKDIDIIVYPHKSGIMPNKNHVCNLLERAGFNPSNHFGTSENDFICKYSKDEKIIDFFLMGKM